MKQIIRNNPTVALWIGMLAGVAYGIAKLLALMQTLQG